MLLLRFEENRNYKDLSAIVAPNQIEIVINGSEVEHCLWCWKIILPSYSIPKILFFSDFFLGCFIAKFLEPLWMKFHRMEGFVYRNHAAASDVI